MSVLQESKVFLVLTLVGLLSPLTMAHAQITTETNRKAVTNANCLNILPDGSSIISKDRVKFPDHSLHYYPANKCDSSSSVVVPTINGWIESTWQDETNGFASISDIWGVPPAPQNNDNQVVFLFDSIQWFGPGFSGWIVQPVLTWGCVQRDVLGLCLLGGPNWWVASWAVFTNFDGSVGPTYVTPSLVVLPGDGVNGQVVRQVSDSSCNGQQGYEIRAIDPLTGTTREHLTLCDNNIGTEANPGVLEAYSINSCYDLPSEFYQTFASISSTPAETQWGGGVNVGHNVSPNCSYAVTTTSNSVTLFFAGTTGSGGGCSPTRASGPKPCGQTPPPG